MTGWMAREMLLSNWCYGSSYNADYLLREVYAGMGTGWIEPPAKPRPETERTTERRPAGWRRILRIALGFALAAVLFSLSMRPAFAATSLPGDADYIRTDPASLYHPAPGVPCASAKRPALRLIRSLRLSPMVDPPRPDDQQCAGARGGDVDWRV